MQTDFQPIASVVMKSKPNPKVEKIIQDAGFQKPIIKTMSDREGLALAYQQPNHIYVNENKMYVAGSKSIADWRDNIMFIPQNLTKYHNIYKSAEAELKTNPQVDHLIGHSAGGATVVELQKQYPEKRFKTTTYNAPIISNTPPKPGDLRFTTQGDIVNAFDFGGTNVKVDSSNPLTLHSYKNYGDTGSNIGKQIM